MPPQVWRVFIRLASIAIALVFLAQLACAVAVWIARALAWLLARF